uniref:Heparanase n=1 Tax=Salarias fasciatus TaxID=181472 RepID=A0A672J1L7_SALFA
MLLLLLLALLSPRAAGDPGPRPGSWTWTRTRPRPSPRDSDVYLDLDLSSVRHRVDTRFLSFTIDASLAEKERFMALLSSVKLQTLTKALRPAFLRFGGSRQDFMEFQPGESKGPRNLTSESCGLTLLPWWLEEQLKEEWAQFQEILIKEDLEADYGDLKFTATTVDQLYSFSSCCGLDLVFGLNALLRTKENSWDGANAALLLEYCQARGYRMSWELGNEPNSFRKKAGVVVDGQQLGRDFAQLRELMSRFELYRQAGLYGPDVSQPRHRRADILDGFLETGAQSIDAVTWHHYYVCGRDTSLNDFLNPDILDTLNDNITKILEKVKHGAPGKPVWLGETSSAYGGGAPGLSNAFVAGFMWLDKLGLAASRGLQVVMRQALIGPGKYQLVDPNLDPFPDYWLSILHKRLVGRRVLRVEMLSQLGQGERVRVYLHCASKRRQTVHKHGAVVLLSMNLSDEPAVLFLPPSVSSSSVEAFVLQADQPGEQGVLSRNVMLNGVVLKMVDDRTFPDLRGTRLPPADRLQLPPFSMAFFLFHEAGAPACS